MALAAMARAVLRLRHEISDSLPVRIMVAQLFVVAFGPVLPARMAQEVAWDDEFVERRYRVTAPITLGSRSKIIARGTYLQPEAT